MERECVTDCTVTVRSGGIDMTNYYVVYKNMNKEILSKENLHTTSLVKARAKVVKSIDMNPYISGGIYTNADAVGLPVGYIFFPKKGPIWSHFWVAFINGVRVSYLTDSSGKITRMEKK